MTAIVFRHATVIPVDTQRRIIEDGAVRVLDDRIDQVGPDAEVLAQPGDRIIDCRGKLIIPGLVDAHGHAGHCLIRSIASDVNPQWMKIVTPIYYHATTREFWYADGLVSGLERLRAGVTTGVSIISSMPRSDDPVFAVNHARAYSEIGLREVICIGPAGLPWPREVTRWETGEPKRRSVTFAEMMEGAEAAIQMLDGSDDGRIRVYLTPFTIVPSIETSNISTPDQAIALTPDDRMHARIVRELARKHRVRLHSDAFAGHIRLAWQDKENALLGPDIHLQHCWGISPAEIEILAETGTHVTHAPPGRSTPVIEMMARGINVALTTDGTAPSRYFDMLQTARLFQSVQHVLRNHDRFFFPPGKVLEMITIDAARALGMEDQIGSLESGKKADLVIVDMNRPHLTPQWMPVHRLIHQATGADVDLVMVDGNILLEGGRVTTTDEGEALRRAEQEAIKLVQRSGASRYMHDPGWGQLYRTFKE
ncbi:amidohydrolase family protein [Paracoccus aerius]|uniref:Amidohydrolase family protein n=1 Tax=Paracoccus aerius TaxID=1915382 RepID=A0ABS1S9C3_9RHOB|nr:amidohydrolase family protein [Paracoccus aerius]MBL3675342.1 amidohydrolase family protein [Paracoccus aerius]GHG32693.1 hydrolase [Paracoccus aerius]